MTTPRYQDIASANIPELDLPGGVKARLIAGHVGSTAGAVTDIYADPTYLDITLPPETLFTHSVPVDHSVFAYLFRGKGLFGVTASEVEAPRLVLFESGDVVKARASEEGARFLLVSGLPLGEPIARYGPFVMNTKAEIEQTLMELGNGTFIKTSN
jgi:redox-sensitive bicupin YhaK (pirin superfamily)